MDYNKLLNVALFSPVSIQFPNSWVGHLPFAKWIIESCSPAVFVELGTHSGNSYFSFCQSIVECNLPTKCYAVDTWQGDEQAGTYGEDVFSQVNQHNQHHYGNFSQLIRSTFDEAVRYFSDKSIDLLHIDGLHTYEAVRHDFENWLKKLAPGAVVLFHDINVRERDFGVWKLWEELQVEYVNNLSFLHSNGLGVLQLNDAETGKQIHWLRPDCQEKKLLVDYFASLGQRQIERYESGELLRRVASLKQNLEQLVSERDVHINNLTQHAKNLEQLVSERDVHISNLTQHSKNLEQLVFERDERIRRLAQHATNLTQLVAKRDEKVGSLNRTQTETEKQKSSLFQLVAEKDTMIRERDTLIRDLYALVNEKEELLDSVLASKSWKLTKPLRNIMLLLKKPTCPATGEGHAAATSPIETPAEPAVQLVPEAPAQVDDGETGLDPEFYYKAYPDIRGMDLYNHYARWGRQEGRLPRAPELFDRSALDRFDPMKDTVLVVSHEASRTGAPILALNIVATLSSRYNVVVFCLWGGDLLDDFRKACTLLFDPAPQKFNEHILSAILDQVLPLFNFKFAIVNSIVSKFVLPALACHFVPTLCLVHEFASYTHPRNTIREVLFWTDRIVFSASLVYENNARECEELPAGRPVILAQGKCAAPARNEFENAAGKTAIRKAMRPDSLPPDTVLILGAGTVNIRKGVDLFIACAARVLALQPSKPFRFVWAGSGFSPETDLTYSVYLQDQVNRAGLTEHLSFIGETAEIDLVYALSDILLLSSRLDPLPNVAIDAMYQGLPVLCFDHTTGIADLLKENGLGESCVLPYLDVEQAAQRLVTLIDQTEERRLLGEKVCEVGRDLFDMQGYVRTLEGLAEEFAVRQDIAKEDFDLIVQERAIDIDFFRPGGWAAFDGSELVCAYLRSWSLGVDRRKPFPGFHPGLYLEHHGVEQLGRDPLADFLRSGRPAGPWLTELIEPSSPAPAQQDGTVRAALHVHVFFDELFVGIYERLVRQPLPLDLLISVPSVEVAGRVAALTREYANGFVDIRQVPNRGRDIGPLLTEFGSDILQRYELIGHVHTKKSGHVEDEKMGQRWFAFLLENLVGGQSPMASNILGRMISDENLGLVFPADPYVFGWNANREIAVGLARELGIDNLPNEFFNFPLGTMFWARTRAIEPLLARQFMWVDYPEEPLPIDGTMLHAIERLLPAIASHAGYRTAMTHVPGVTRRAS